MCLDYFCKYVPYNRNIRRREMLANRLNFPIGENLNWRNSMVGSRNFMDATIDTHEWAREAKVENFNFLVMHSFLTLATALLASSTCK